MGGLAPRRLSFARVSSRPSPCRLNRDRVFMDITALGSSFASGPGLLPLVNTQAGRSERNYPHIVSTRVGVPLVDATVRGARIRTVLDQSQRVGWTVFKPQIESVRPEADLVTVTVGGNDIRYIQRINTVANANLALQSGANQSLWSRRWSHRRDRALAPHSDEQQSQVAFGLEQIANAIRGRAPLARVLFVDYLPVLDESSVWSDDLPLTPRDTQFFIELARRLTDAYQVSAQRSGADLISASDLEPGHAVGSLTPWVSGLVRERSTVASFHPTGAGMQAVADKIVEYWRAER